jgi:formyl-CoA transferase
MVIAANADNVFRRLSEAMGQPELADHPHYATHHARGEHQAELEAIVAAWAGERDAVEIDSVLNEAGVICGPIYTIADIFADEHYRARDMLLEHECEELGAFVGPGIVPKFSDTPGSVHWTGPWEEGRHNADVYGELLGLPEKDLDELRAEGIL